MDKKPAPPLLPIFRSQQQVEPLALLLGDAALEAGDGSFHDTVTRRPMLPVALEDGRPSGA